MPIKVLRLRTGPSLPHQTQRIAVLERFFGEPVTIIDIWPTEDPGQLFNYVSEKIASLDASAIEIDTRDRMLAAFLAVGAWMKAFGDIPVLYPLYRNEQGEGFPNINLKSHKVEVPDDAHLVGYAELCDAVPVPRLRQDITV